MTVIDITLAQARRDRADAEHVRDDGSGRLLYRFALEYRMDGRAWAAEVWAYDFADAAARAGAMRDSLKVLGQVCKVIPQ